MALADLMDQLKKNSLDTAQRRAEAEQRLAQAAASFAMKRANDSVSRGTSRGGPTTNVNYKRGNVDPNAPMKSLKFNGMTYQVNASVAGRFQGFLKALAKQGYVPKSIGGYSNRNIAGTNTKSLHSYGLAIDIDPGSNPVTYGKIQTTLPKNVGKLASQYGITWGGDWKGNKKDTMHFSVPYFGTK